jgi:ABC-type uncharacterized transport system permease subunit
MKNINNSVFLNKITQKIERGEFDSYLTLPFMTRVILLNNIKSKINKKLITGGTPILSDSEIKESINDIKETALNIILIYMKLGFIERTENGLEFTDKFNLAIRVANKL